MIADTKMNWTESAACAGKGGLFFEDNRPSVVRKAKAICKGCAVREACLEYATENSEYGLWGGMTANERRIRKSLSKHGIQVA